MIRQILRKLIWRQTQSLTSLYWPRCASQRILWSNLTQQTRSCLVQWIRTSVFWLPFQFIKKNGWPVEMAFTVGFYFWMRLLIKHPCASKTRFGWTCSERSRAATFMQLNQAPWEPTVLESFLLLTRAEMGEVGKMLTNVGVGDKKCQPLTATLTYLFPCRCKSSGRLVCGRTGKVQKGKRQWHQWAMVSR